MSDLAVTPLYDLHLELGAKMVPFAGYSMPVQYSAGVMKEHLHTRTQAGLFDVSHMGQVWIDGPSWESIALGFETLVPQDVLGLQDGRQRYGFLTNDAGGIEDDLMFARRGDRLFVVVNAACKHQDIARMKTGLPSDLVVTEVTDRALVALQGPKAENVLGVFHPKISETRFMDVFDVSVLGHTVWVSRSGYTGEDGFELSMPSDAASSICKALLADDAVEAIGLGARDSLRLEAGLCLYGHDINATTTPVEAGLKWAIQKSRRNAGSRAGGFPGSDTVLAQMDGSSIRTRIGLLPEGRAPMREGVALFATETSDTELGQVTSGGFGPSVQAPIAMGYVSSDHATIGKTLFGEVRGKRLPVTVTEMPFTPHTFKR